MIQCNATVLSLDNNLDDFVFLKCILCILQQICSHVGWNQLQPWNAQTIFVKFAFDISKLLLVPRLTHHCMQAWADTGICKGMRRGVDNLLPVLGYAFLYFNDIWHLEDPFLGHKHERVATLNFLEFFIIWTMSYGLKRRSKWRKNSPTFLFLCLV